VGPTLAGEQDGQGDAHKNGSIENDERAVTLHAVDAMAGAPEDGQENFRQGPQGNHQLNNIFEDQGLHRRTSIVISMNYTNYLRGNQTGRIETCISVVNKDKPCLIHCKELRMISSITSSRFTGKTAVQGEAFLATFLPRIMKLAALVLY
jgi:hypothetical protein